MTVSSARADIACTIIARADTGDVLVEEGDCGTRATPASTFKLPLAVIGFETRTLISPTEPAVAFDPDTHVAWIDSWKAETTPERWLRESVVWYSWEVTRPLGIDRMTDYLQRFSYGNADMSGTPGADNGITHAWLSSSLQISPREQIAFLSALLMRRLPVRVFAQSLAMEATASFPFGDGQVAKGKTGNGFALGADGEMDRDRQIGWFVGWTGPQDAPIVFARLIRDEVKRDGYASFEARDSMLADLPGYLGARPSAGE